MKHIDAENHVRGTSQYIDDIPQPADLLFAAVFSSPVAHGIIKKLDVKNALKMKGVEAVFTAKDIPGENQIGPIIQDEELLVEKTVHFQGEPIAIVVAKSQALARKAVKAIVVEISELPAITDPRVAFAKGELIAPPRTFSMGNVDETWDKCDLVVAGKCEMGGQEHVYLETQRARAIPLEEKGIRIYSSTQSPYAVQRITGNVLGLPYHKIEVEVKRLGGGFGGKEDQATQWSCMVALAAFHLQKPVEIVLNRMEDVKMTGKRHPYSSDFKMGLSKEGKILAYEAKHYQNSGAAADLSTPVLERTLFHSTNAYFIPNVRVFAACCRTNLPPNTAFRGFGGPQGMFVLEAAIAKAAEKSGLPREEIQAKNLLQDGDSFYYGQVAENSLARKTWQEAVNTFDFLKIKKQVDNFNQDHFDVKKGVAIMPVCFGISFTATFMNQGSSLVHVYTDGSVSVSTGGIEMGQGLNTNMVKIAARTFGIYENRIKIEPTNTTRIANMSPSAASATTDINGNATILAVNQIMDGLKAIAVKELGENDEEKISVKDETILYGGKKTSLTWSKLVQAAYLSRTKLSAHAFYATPNIHFDRDKEKGRPFAYHVFGTAITEVTVDCLRGRYDIDSVKIVHDLGRPVNELTDRGQIEGGLAQGLGWMTIEDLQFDKNGKLLSNALSTYKAPDVYFMPDDLQVRLLENVDNKPGPYGSKAVGEPPLMYGIGVFYAIRYAMRAYRPDLEFEFHAPLTPERVLMELYKDKITNWIKKSKAMDKKETS